MRYEWEVRERKTVVGISVRRPLLGMCGGTKIGKRRIKGT